MPMTGSVASNNLHTSATQKCIEPVQNAPNILAVVIGINKYSGDSSDYNDLTGAVGDADSFEDFLTSRLRVPKSNIRSLRDDEATRDRILDAFVFLRDTDLYSKGDCEIIIYYAGHGAQETIPDDWKDWYTPTGRIEMLCPSDIGQRKVVEQDGQSVEGVVPGIPDRTISFLLNQISHRKGNHITVILDCCSSAGMNRSSMDADGHLPRQIYNAPPINSSIDKQYVRLGPRTTYGAKEYTGRFRASHVLLAACGREQLAWEDPKTRRGLFTYNLLKILQGNELDTLTYRSLMDKLSMPKKQTPHCEGEGVHQLLFGNRTFGADTAFIYGKRVKDGPITIEAGAAHGITCGARFSVHKTSMMDTSFLPNQSIGHLVATSVDNFQTVLTLSPETPNAYIPWRFYCKAINPAPRPIILYSKDMEWLQSIFPSDKRDDLSVYLTDDPTKCDLELVIEDDMIYFDRWNSPVIEHIGSRMLHSVLLDDKITLYSVVKAAAHFTYHLTRSAPGDADRITVEMKELQIEYSDDFDGCTQPIGDNLLAKEPAIVAVHEDRCLGMTVINDSDETLYPYLFYFDPNDFSIIEWYTPPLAAGQGRLIASQEVEMKSSPSPNLPTVDNVSESTESPPPPYTSRLKIGVDAPLPAKARLTVGYGNSGSQPWNFFIPDGRSKDVGFFRLFLSTQPSNFQSIIQPSPFECTRGQQPESPPDDPSEPPPQWMVKTATVIQVLDSL